LSNYICLYLCKMVNITIKALINVFDMYRKDAEFQYF
jgi:hypothetical protein